MDLKRILWHEMGHFVVDLVEEKYNQNNHIDDVWVSYHKYANSDHKWAGGVQTLPEINIETTSKEIDKASYTLLNLISGCLFQTYFLKEIQKENVNFNDCFSYSRFSAGRGDFYKFDTLISYIRKKYGENEKLKTFLGKELKEDYRQNLIKNANFLNKTKGLIENYSNLILKKHQQYKENTEFKYSFKNEDKLELLKKEINYILKKNNFDFEIEKIKNKIKEKIES